jgi:hypothetical protein
MISSIIQPRITSILLGVALIGYAIYDLNEELLNPTHEHILIVIGMLLVISSFGHVNEGVHKIVQGVAPQKELPVMDKIATFFHRPMVRIILGVTILIAAAYGLYDDYEKIHSKSISMGIGLLTMMLPAFKAFLVGNNLVKGFKNGSGEDSETLH